MNAGKVFRTFIDIFPLALVLGEFQGGLAQVNIYTFTYFSGMDLDRPFLMPQAL